MAPASVVRTYDDETGATRLIVSVDLLQLSACLLVLVCVLLSGGMRSSAQQ